MIFDVKEEIARVKTSYLKIRPRQIRLTGKPSLDN